MTKDLFKQAYDKMREQKEREAHEKAVAQHKKEIEMKQLKDAQLRNRELL